VDVLIRYFNKDIEQANQIMMHVHRNGKGLC
jgi:ATP-dependent Clp protease adapter protein ClpS